MGRLSRLNKLGSEVKRIGEAKKRIKDIQKLIKSGVNVGEWFLHLGVTINKETFCALLQAKISKIDTYKKANTECQARYMTIVYETIENCPSEKIIPKDAIEIGKQIEKKLTQYDSENPN
jgi:hypothetical protein